MNTASNTYIAGYTVDQLRLAITKEWHLSGEEQQFLAAYFLRRWHTANVLALVKEGCLHFEDRRYQVQWVGGKVAATSNEFCYMSFRKTNSPSIQSTVLINKENY